MINITIGYNADDFAKDRLTFRIEKNNVGVKMVNVNCVSVRNNATLFIKYLKLKCKPFIDYEKYITIKWAVKNSGTQLIPL